MGDYTHVNLDDVEDQAPKFGHGEVQEARFAQAALGIDSTGVSLMRVKPGCKQGFGHRHDEAEEVYVVTAGSGTLFLDDEQVELKRLDAIRIAPEVARRAEAGPDGLELLAFGPHHQGDGELLPDFAA